MTHIPNPGPDAINHEAAPEKDLDRRNQIKERSGFLAPDLPAYHERHLEYFKNIMNRTVCSGGKKWGPK